MVSGVFRTKEKRIFLAVLALVLIIAGIFFYDGYRSRKKYEQQTVMAKEYLEAGNYEQAVEAYMKAMSMKFSDQEALSIGLADAYAGINEYDKALEILRNCYLKTSGTLVKEKIEEITAIKTDYDFNQIISHADTFFTNGEYDKAIAEYEKAKLIKSKEAVSYRKIAESYIAIGNYALAKEEIIEGLALTQKEELNETLKKVDAHLLQAQYDEIVSSASEYIYQENYEEAIKKYKEAISLLPKEENAYNRLAEAYIVLGDYEQAVLLMQTSLRNKASEESEKILEQANTFIFTREERKRILKELYTAVTDLDTNKILTLMGDSFFIEKIASQGPVYSNPSGEADLSAGLGIIVLDKNNIYAGGVRDDQKSGVGTYFMLVNRETEHGWYYYQGEWTNDIPNGLGSACEEYVKVDEEGKTYREKTITSGLFSYGLENGSMQKQFYRDEKELGFLNYMAQNGVPVPYQREDGGSITPKEADHYVIGELYRKDEPTGEYYSVKHGTEWKVEITATNKEAEE